VTREETPVLLRERLPDLDLLVFAGAGFVAWVVVKSLKRPARVL
jgi:hypothetical protein